MGDCVINYKKIVLFYLVKEVSFLKREDYGNYEIYSLVNKTFFRAPHITLITGLV